MARYLKSAPPTTFADRSHRDVAEKVARIIADVRTRGDAAVRDYSGQFDSWTPDSFRLDDGPGADTRRLPSAAGDRRHHVRPDPGARLRAGAAGLDAPTSRSRPCPACSSATGTSRSRPPAPTSPAAVPADGIGAHDGRDREGRGCRASGCLHAPDPGRDPRGDHRRDEPGRRGRDLRARRRPGGGCDGCRHRVRRAGRLARGSRQRVRGRGQAPALRRGRDRPVRRPDRDPRLADENADPFIVAVDLLSQAEHGPDSPAVLVTTCTRSPRRSSSHIDADPARDADQGLRRAGLAGLRPGASWSTTWTRPTAGRRLRLRARAGPHRPSRARPSSGCTTTAPSSWARTPASPTATR